MKSIVELNLDDIVDDKPGAKVEIGDIILLKDMSSGDRFLARVDTSEIDNVYRLARIGEAVVYKLNVIDVHVNTVIETRGYNKFKVLGICDIEINIVNIRK